MLQKMRDHSQSLATKILLGVLIVVFTMFGFGAFEAFMSPDPPAAQVNGVKISQGELALEVDRQKQVLLSQMGEGADPDLLDTDRLRTSVLDRLINQTLLMESADEMGLRVSDAEVDRVIVDNPQFQTGSTFDAELYRRLLANLGYTPATFKTEVTNNFTVSQLTGAVRQTPFVTESEARDAARLVAQKRDIATLVFAPEQFDGEVTIGDDDVNAYYQAHLPDFMTPDTVDVDYVQLTIAELAQDPALAPTDDQILAQYEADAAAFKPTERRHLAHILLQVGDSRTEAAAIAELTAAKGKLDAGEPFDALARTMSEDPGSAQSGGDLGSVSKGALTPEFEKAAWSLQVNQVSEPVRTEFGVHLIKVIAIENDPFPALDEMRPQIVTRLREGGAEEKFRTKLRELDELAFEMPDGLKHVSEVTGLEIQHVKDVTATEGAAPFDVPALRTAAFVDDVVTKGFNSRAIETDKRAYVLRVSEHRPPVQRPLADVAGEIRARLTAAAATDRARAVAKEATERVAKGEGSATIAAAYGLEWQRTPAVTRATSTLESAVTQAAFGLPRPTDEVRSVTSTDLGGGRVAVVTVTAVNDGDYGALTETDRAAIRTQLARRVGDEEFMALFVTLRDSASIERP